MPRTREQTLALGGSSKELITTTSAWYDVEQNVRGVIGIAQDVTERRRWQREAAQHDGRMRSMATEIVIGEEHLRRSLAADLHGGLGQYLALAKLKLSMLRSTASTDLHDSLRGIEQLVEHADRSLRSVTLQISPHTLHELGLVAALQWLGEDLGGRYGLDIRIEGDDAPGISEERVRVILFRAVRELLVNVSTHAHVRAAVVSVARDSERVRVTVQDAGTGFDIADLERNGHGLLGIREQLKFIGGVLQVETAPGSGTKVTLTAPDSDPTSAAGR
jgi:signal transduction histidine kinase